ncbi:MAG: hypothetical protein IJW00_09120 [Clostridia bacterium]|nr:hypothetical protein [Clostridia bacterium]
MNKALTTVFVIIFTLLFTHTCFLGNAAMAWASEMDNMTHFDLYSSPTKYGKEARKFYTDTGLCYEAVDVPEGVTRAMLTEGLSLREYDEIVTSEWGTEYRLYRDPMQTGENYVLLVPAVGVFNIPFTTITRPLGYYAKEVPKV